MIGKHSLLLGLLMTGACATPDTEVIGRLRTDTLRLINGDSVELQARLPAVVANTPPGRMYIYYPFQDLTDTVRLRRIALGVLTRVSPELESKPPSFLVMRAVNLPTAQRVGRYNIATYGFVIERRLDGHWYFRGESEAVR